MNGFQVIVNEDTDLNFGPYNDPDDLDDNCAVFILHDLYRHRFFEFESPLPNRFDPALRVSDQTVSLTPVLQVEANLDVVSDNLRVIVM